MKHPVRLVLRRLLQRGLLHAGLVLLAAAPGLPVLAQQMPRWAERLPDLPLLPDAYQGLGSAPFSGDAGADWQKASGQARAQILQQIRVQVMSRVSSRVEENAKANSAALSSAFSSTTEQLAGGTLEGLLVERWYDEDRKTLYAYAAVSRAEVNLRLEEKLRQAVASARLFREAARKATGEGKILLAIEQYLQAAKGVAFAEVYLNRVLEGAMDGTGGSRPVLPLLQTELCDLVHALRFRVTGGDGQEVEPGRAFALPLTGVIAFEGSTGVRPAGKLPLAASFLPPASGSLPGLLETNEAGEFTLSAAELRAGAAMNVIRVRLAIPEFELLAGTVPDAARCVPEAHLDFTVSVKTRAGMTVAMHILEYNLAQKRVKSSVQEEVQKRLLGDRYVVLEESRAFRRIPDEKLHSAVRSGDFHQVVAGLSGGADLIVVGMVATEERGNPVEGMFFSTGTAVIRAIEAKSGQIVASVSLENQKEGGGSYEVAGLRLLQKMGKKIGEELQRSINDRYNLDRDPHAGGRE